MKSAFGVEHISKSKKRDAALVGGSVAGSTGALVGLAVGAELKARRKERKLYGAGAGDLWTDAPSMPKPPPSSTPSNVGPPPPKNPYWKPGWSKPGVRQRGIPGDKFPKAKLDDIFSAAKQAGKLK